MSLTKKLIFAFLLVTVVPLGLIIWVSHETFVENAEQQVGARLENDVVQAARSVDGFMLGCIGDLKSQAAEPARSSSDLGLGNKTLARFTYSFPSFNQVMLVNPQGVVVQSSYGPSVGKSLFTLFDYVRDEFELAIHGPPGPVYLSHLGEVPERLGGAAAKGRLTNLFLNIQMLTLVRDAEGHSAGVLVGDVVTSPIRDLLQDLNRRSPGDKYPYLLDKEGRVLMSPDPQVHLLSRPPDITKSALQDPPGSRHEHYLVYADANGRRIMAARTSLLTYGTNQAGDWRLITFARYDTIMEPATKAFNQMLGVLFATLAAAVGFGFWVARRLADPVLKLTQGAKTIASGQFEARVLVTTRDEIGALANAFNQMADTLQRSLGALQTEVMQRTQAQRLLHRANDELEQRVEERTAQLTDEIAERKQAEVTLRERETQLNAYFDSSPTGMLMVDRELRYLKINHTLAELSGAPIEDHLGKTMRELVPDAAAFLEPLFQRVFATGKSILNVERSGIKPSRPGEVFYWEASYFPIMGEDGKPTAVGGVTLDVTVRKEAEQQLLHAMAAAEKANRAKSEFLANMSHEIRTPMNGVIGMTGLLLDSELSPMQREFGETIRGSAEALLTIINDILDFSKIEAGKLTFEILDFGLSEMVEGTLDMLAERAHGKGIELAGVMSQDLPTRLRGDPGRLRQVLTNLVGNALKFTEKGEVVVRVSRESETGMHVLVRFAVEDTGIGISCDAQNRLFQAFSQADNSTTRKYGGTGLGLAIAKQLVTMMNGQIGVQSEPNKGSTFWFTAELEKQAGNATLPEPSHRPLSNARVLAVDDNATTREILRHQLGTWKMRPECAAGGAEALEMMRAAVRKGQPYELALLDVQMPEMDGLTLARLIKADPAISATRLIILTPFGQTLGTQALKAAGIEAHLVKPLKPSRLFDCLVGVMGEIEVANVEEQSFTSAVEPKPLQPSVPSEKVRILLAEDNIINQKVALGQLRKLRCRADAVANGLEVLEALQHVPYDVILMDCQMPEMDGYEATRAIRQREQRSPCPWRVPVYVIAMTANAMQGDREKCLEAGMDDYVSKPIRLEAFTAALARALPRGAEEAL